MKLILERHKDWEGWKCVFIAELRAKHGTEEKDTYYQFFKYTRNFRYKDDSTIVEPEFQLKVLDITLEEGWEYTYRYMEDYVNKCHWYPNGIMGNSPFKKITEYKLPLIWWIE